VSERISDKHVLDMITDYCRRSLDADPRQCICTRWLKDGQERTKADLDEHHPACPVLKSREWRPLVEDGRMPHESFLWSWDRKAE